MTKILEINATTGEQVSRQMTPQELEQYEADKAEHLARQQAEAEKQAKIESAKAKLTALGLDEAEVQAILGLYCLLS